MSISLQETAPIVQVSDRNTLSRLSLNEKSLTNITWKRGNLSTIYHLDITNIRIKLWYNYYFDTCSYVLVDNTKNISRITYSKEQLLDWKSIILFCVIWTFIIICDLASKDPNKSFGEYFVFSLLPILKIIFTYIIRWFYPIFRTKLWTKEHLKPIVIEGSSFCSSGLKTIDEDMEKIEYTIRNLQEYIKDDSSDIITDPRTIFPGEKLLLQIENPKTTNYSGDIKITDKRLIVFIRKQDSYEIHTEPIGNITRVEYGKIPISEYWILYGIVFALLGIFFITARMIGDLSPLSARFAEIFAFGSVIISYSFFFSRHICVIFHSNIISHSPIYVYTNFEDVKKIEETIRLSRNE
jgi:hypothetical protein